MTNFDTAISFVLKEEGGLVNDPQDPGGLTKFGISSRSYPSVDIRALTEAQAKEIYRRDYWVAISGDALPLALGIPLLDCAVHSGPSKAIQLLQDTLQIKADGNLGPVTKSAIAMYVAQQSPEALAVGLVQRRTKFLVNQCRSQPSKLKFLTGWMLRLQRLILAIYNR